MVLIYLANKGTVTVNEKLEDVRQKVGNALAHDLSLIEFNTKYLGIIFVNPKSIIMFMEG